MKFSTKPIRHYPPHLRNVATLPREIKNSTFCGYPADMEENENKWHFKCSDLNSTTRVPVYAEGIYVFLSKSCRCRWIPCWFVDKHCNDVCCDEFPVPQTDRKSKRVKEQWHGKFYLQSVWENTRYFKHWQYQNLWMNNKGRGDKNASCWHFHPYVLSMCTKFAFLISQGSVATCLRWAG